MARCPRCSADIPDHARYCPQCGTEQGQHRPTQQQLPPLPFSPWGPPPAVQTAGGGVSPRAEPQTGPPLTGWQVGISVGAILLFLAFVIVIGQGGIRWPWSSSTETARKAPLPVIGVKGQSIDVGSTAWGVAFTDQVEQIDNKSPQRGQYFAVGVVIGNKGANPILLNSSSVGLIETQSGERFTPAITAWGTPDQIHAQQYVTEFTLPPGKAIAGLIVFDAPATLPQPGLMIRDLTGSDTDFTGMIDLTRQTSDQ